MVAFIAPGPNTRDVMYIATTNPSRYEFAPIIISSRSIVASSSTSKRFDFAQVTKKSGTLIETNPNESPTMNYVYGFSSEGFSYFIKTQLKENAFRGQTEYVTHLIRVCQNDQNYYSYTEVPVQCIDGNKEYSLMQAAYMKTTGLANERDDAVLYAAFSKTENEIKYKESAICIYSLKSIRNIFTQNIYSCFGSRQCKGSPRMMKCLQENLTVEECFCVSNQSNGNYSNKGELMITASPVATFQETLTAILATTKTYQKNNKSASNEITVILAGTVDGHMKKLVVDSINSATEYEDIKIYENVSITAGMHFDVNEQHIYVMAANNLAKVKAYDCTAFSDCRDCNDVNMKDPYCGYCSIENKCANLKSSLKTVSKEFDAGIDTVAVISVVASVVILASMVLASVWLIINRVPQSKQVDSVIEFQTGDPARINPELTLDEQADLLPYDDSYEFPSGNLVFGKRLGNGNFGVVYYAKAKNILPNEDSTDVAVKQVKAASSDQVCLL